jgi:hypothetical protein
VFRRTSADTGGELVAIELALPVGGHVPGLHIRALMAPLRALARRRDYRKASRKSSQTHSTAAAAA